MSLWMFDFVRPDGKIDGVIIKGRTQKEAIKNFKLRKDLKSSDVIEITLWEK